MSHSTPVFIADTCIGGLSVVKSLWAAGDADDVVFLADYAINPLGVKPDADITAVIDRWLQSAAERSDTMVMACNTLSVRYDQSFHSRPTVPAPRRVVSMVDCFRAMVHEEAAHLADKRVLIIGTRYTASQRLYPGILEKAAPGVRTEMIAATELERVVARLEQWDSAGESVLTAELRQALSDTDVAMLACTCFPMVATTLESLFPNVIFLDPGAYCPGLLPKQARPGDERLRLRVTGDVVSSARAAEFARSYLHTGNIECCN